MPRPRYKSDPAPKGFVNINANFIKQKPRYDISQHKGRAKGTKNLVNKTVREMFQEFVFKNASTAQDLYDKVARKNPEAALKILTNMADFVLPRLARTEMAVSGQALVSANPIASASEAAQVYAAILGSSKIDLTQIVFATPPQLPIVAEQGPRPDNVVALRP
ncbi:MAG TPA: hypothetical protein VGI90_14480 [Steroidobacteraceae bacterium]|jgi:hypothetical protein